MQYAAVPAAAAAPPAPLSPSSSEDVDILSAGSAASEATGASGSEMYAMSSSRSGGRRANGTGNRSSRVISGVELEARMRADAAQQPRGGSRPAAPPARRPPSRQRQTHDSAMRRTYGSTRSTGKDSTGGSGKSRPPSARQRPKPAPKPKASPLVLQKRFLPMHIKEAGGAERYYMELQQVSAQRQRLQEANVELERRWADAEAQLSAKQKMVEELLAAACTVGGDGRLPQLLSTHQAIKTLRESVQVVAAQIEEKTAELEDVTLSQDSKHIRELEGRVRVYFTELEALQKKATSADRSESLERSRHELRNANQLLESKEAACRKAEVKLAELGNQEQQLEQEKAALALQLIAEQRAVEALQATLGEERRMLLQEMNAVPLEVERLRAELQTAEAYKRTTVANLERTKQQSELSIAQLQASFDDTQGRIERLDVKQDLQRKRMTETRKEITRLQQCVLDRDTERRAQSERVEEALARSSREEGAAIDARIAREQKALRTRRADLRADVEDAQAAWKAAQRQHVAEVEEASKRHEERLKILLDKLPTPSTAAVHADSEERRRMELLQGENLALLKQINVLKRSTGQKQQQQQLRQQEPAHSAHSPGARSDEAERAREGQQSDCSDKGESEVTRVKMDPDPDPDAAVSLCRGAGSISACAYGDPDLSEDDA